MTEKEKKEPLIKVLRRELRARGWRQEGLAAHRTVPSWRKGKVRAASLNDAIIKQLIEDAEEAVHND